MLMKDYTAEFLNLEDVMAVSLYPLQVGFSIEPFLNTNLLSQLKASCRIAQGSKYPAKQKRFPKSAPANDKRSCLAD